MPWSQVVDVLRGSLFVLAHWCGGSLGAAILLASVATRVAMLPLTLPAARRRLSAKPGFDRQALLDALVQIPPGAALYSAIRAAGVAGSPFLWIADLARPDRLLAALAALLAAALAWLAAATPAGKSIASIAPLVITAAMTFLILSHLSAGLALVSLANSVIGSAERAVAVRGARPRPV